MCTNRKLRSSKLFDPSGPSYTPYHLVMESRESTSIWYLLLWLIRAPLRQQRRYHADPLPTGTSIVVYICVPIANYTAASCLIHRGLPTHHTIWWWRVDLYMVPPALANQGTSSTTATVLSQFIAQIRCKRRLHMCANRKLRSS